MLSVRSTRRVADARSLHVEFVRATPHDTNQWFARFTENDSCVLWTPIGGVKDVGGFDAEISYHAVVQLNKSAERLRSRHVNPQDVLDGGQDGLYRLRSDVGPFWGQDHLLQCKVYCVSKDHVVINLRDHCGVLVGDTQP